MKVVFYGDSYLDEYSYVYVFQDGERIIACDFTECGMWVASHYALAGYKGKGYKLLDFLKSLPKDTRVDAYNNGIARFLSAFNIKTVKDFIEVIE